MPLEYGDHGESEDEEEYEKSSPGKLWCGCGHLLRDHNKDGRCLGGSDNGGCVCRETHPVH